jgi:membrane fusion protein, multidrug efflux system
VDDARRELVYTEVRAPISGKITRRLVRLGDHVTNNQHLFDIVDFTSIVAVVHLPEHTLRQLALEQTARVEAPAIGGATFLARVKRISPIIEAKTGTVKVTLGFENIDLLRPGLYVDVEIILAQEPDALLIPRRALVYDADQLYVFKLEEDRRARRMLVEPRLMDRWNVTPVDSFSDGDQIVVAGQTGLKDGAKVRLPSDPKPPDESKNEKGSRR